MFNPFENPIKKKHVNQGNVWIRRIGKVLRFVADGSAVAMEAIWRRKFGEQYLGFWIVGGSLTVFGGLALLFFSPDAQQDPTTGRARAIAVLLAIFVFCNFVRHKTEINISKQKGVVRHSLDNGVSIFTELFNINEFQAKQWVEPLATLALGLVITLLGGSIAATIINMGAVMMWWRERQIQHNQYTEYLSMVNSRINAQRVKQVTTQGWNTYQKNQNSKAQQTKTQSTTASPQSLMAKSSKRR